MSRPPIRVSVLHAGGEPGYLFGLVSGLRKIEDLEIEVVDSDKTLGMFQGWPNVSHYNLRGDQDHSSRLTRKIARVSEYYVRLLVYVSTTKASVLHIQWENKFLLFDRTLLLLYYKLLGKRLVLTAHNVNEAAREGKENMTSHFSLWARYRIVDHIIVHSEQMKRELARDFSVRENKIAVIPHGINNMVRRRGITREEARTALQISMETKLLLFFGNIDRYKGVDLALNALKILIDKDPSFQIAIVGRHKDCSDYNVRLWSTNFSH
ncbi:MAG: glycosyltransferase [Thaumarchaeota archaeon]|nr:glycosyltransferase [Nitrososphaerota archaeon]